MINNDYEWVRSCLNSCINIWQLNNTYSLIDSFGIKYNNSKEAQVLSASLTNLIAIKAIDLNNRFNTSSLTEDEGEEML